MSWGKTIYGVGALSTDISQNAALIGGAYPRGCAMKTAGQSAIRSGDFSVPVKILELDGQSGAILSATVKADTGSDGNSQAPIKLLFELDGAERISVYGGIYSAYAGGGYQYYGGTASFTVDLSALTSGAPCSGELIEIANGSGSSASITLNFPLTFKKSLSVYLSVGSRGSYGTGASYSFSYLTNSW